MTSPIMDRSLALSRIRRLDEMTQAADNWLKKETQSKVSTGQLFEPQKTVSFLSTTAFKECHEADRTKIKDAVDKQLSGPRQKKELTVVFLVHMRDAITKAADEQRTSLTTVAMQQIKEGQWNDRLKTIPTAVLIHGIVPFIQHPVKNPPALSYAFDLCDGNRADAFAEAYVGSRSRAAIKFQALKMLTVSPGFVSNSDTLLYRQIQKTLPMLARAGDITSSCFALCPASNTRLIELLQNSSQGNFKTFVELNNATSASEFYGSWCAVYTTKGTPNLTEAQERCLTGTINPIIHLFKEMQKMKNEFAFGDLSGFPKKLRKKMKKELLAESQTIVKLPERIFLRSLVPYLFESDLGSLKNVSKRFYYTLSTPLCTHPGSGSIDSLTAFFKKYKDKPNYYRKKAPAAEFRNTFNTMTLKNQRTFRKLLWVAGGCKGVNGKGETFSDQIIGKKSYAPDESLALFRAYDMIFALDTLKNLADRFDKEGVDDSEIATIEQEYQKVPLYLRERINRLSYVFIFGAMPQISGDCQKPRGEKIIPTPAFKKPGANAKAYALACRLLAEGNFKLLSRDARNELFCLSRALAECPDQLDRVIVKSAYTHYIKHPKAQNLLIKAIEVLAECPGEGQKYMQGAASDEAGYSKLFNPQVFVTLVHALAGFERS